MTNSITLAPASEPSRHTAASTSSTTLNHLRGPSAAEELVDMKDKRSALIDRLRKLNNEIADAELALLVGGAIVLW